MSGPCLFVQPRRIRRGAALTLVFVSVLATGAAVGSWGAEPGPRQDPQPAGMPARAYAGAVESDQVKAAAAAAQEDGKSGSKAAREVVSRSGDRWGAVYSAREYEGFRQKLDGAYVGVGISAHRDAQGRIAVERVEPGSPAQKAGIRAGDRLRTVDGKNVTGRPVTEVVALLRGPADGSPGTRVELGLRRGGQKWTQELRRARLTTDPVTVDRLSGYNAHRPGAVRIKVDSFTKGTGERIRRAVRSTPGATASCSTCGATPAGWSPRPSPPPPRCSTAAWSPPMTSVVTSEFSTRGRAATPTARWWCWSTAAP